MRAREGGEGGWDRGASPRASCEREMPAAARRRGTGRRAGGGRGGGDPGPRGEIPGSRATSRGRAGRPGPGSLPAPAPCPRRPAPAVPPARRGPREPRPGPAASGRLRPPRPLPRGVYPAPSRCAAAPRPPRRLLWPPRGAGGVGVPGAEGQRTRREGETDAGLAGGQMLGQKVGGYQGDLQTRPPPPATSRGAPTSPPLRLTSDSRGPAPWAPHSPSPTPFVRPGRPRSPPRLWTRAPTGPRSGGGGGRKGQPRLPEERGAPHYAGLARDAWLLASAASAGDVPGLQPSALGDLPSSNSREPWGETVASEPRSALPPPAARLGQPQRPGRRICQADGNSEGARRVRRARYPHPEPTAPALPLETAFSQRSQPDRRKGQTS